MIGSLLYLTTSRLDIMHSIRMMVRFQSKPKESHVMAIKIIFWYLKGTLDLGLWYLGTREFDLMAYTNADYARILDKKSTSGSAYFLGGCLVP